MVKSFGVVYDSYWGRSRGELVVGGYGGVEGLEGRALPRPFALPQGIVRALGSSLIVAGLAGLIFTAAPLVQSEILYRWNALVIRPTPASVPTVFQQGAPLAQAEDIDKQSLSLRDKDKEEMLKLADEWGMPDTRFSIYIPKIKAKAKIVENVDPGNEKVYMEALSKGVAHASGSVLPGMEGATYLFAHSTNAPWNVTQYNAVFYLLREMQPGDEIYVFFLDKLYKYRVTEQKTVAADDVSWLLHAKEGKERLILQTCWPPGTLWKRLIVVAEPIQN